MITFNIAAWRAWAPGLESVAAWQAWSQQPRLLPASDNAPDVSFLPAMQRRRLSRLARMAFSVGWPLAEGNGNGSVKFYLAGNTPAGKASVVTPGVVTNKKTNAFNKTDYQACSWALQSALITLHQAAKNVGANAVTDIASYYKKNERKDPKTYECHAGAVIAGVALKGNLAKVD